MTSEWRKDKENAVSLICKINSLTKRVWSHYSVRLCQQNQVIFYHIFTYFMLLVVFLTNISAKTYHAQEAKHMDPVIMPMPPPHTSQIFLLCLLPFCHTIQTRNSSVQTPCYEPFRHVSVLSGFCNPWCIQPQWLKSPVFFVCCFQFRWAYFEF